MLYRSLIFYIIASLLIACGNDPQIVEPAPNVTLSHPNLSMETDTVAAAPAAQRAKPWKYVNHKHGLYKPHDHNYGKRTAPQEANNPDVDCPIARHTHHTPKVGESRDAHGYGVGWAHTVDNTPHDHISGTCEYRQSYYDRLHENDGHAGVMEVCQVNIGTNANKVFVSIEGLTPVRVEDEKGKKTVSRDLNGDGDKDDTVAEMGRDINGDGDMTDDISESSIGRDLNGDGDTGDTVNEANIGIDLNNDGDTSDTLTESGYTDNYQLDWDGDGDSDNKDRRIGSNYWKCKGAKVRPPADGHDTAQDDFGVDEQ